MPRIPRRRIGTRSRRRSAGHYAVSYTSDFLRRPRIRRSTIHNRPVMMIVPFLRPAGLQISLPHGTSSPGVSEHPPGQQYRVSHNRPLERAGL